MNAPDPHFVPQAHPSCPRFQRRFLAQCCRKFRVSESDAEDIYQTICFTFYRRSPEEQAAIANVEGYLWRAFQYRLWKLRPQQERFAPIDLESVAGRCSDPGVLAEVAERSSIINRAIEELPSPEREVIQGRLSDESVKDIADRLGITKTNVYRCEYRGHALLKRKSTRQACRD